MVRLLRPRSLVNADSMVSSRTETSVSSLAKTMLPLASTEATLSKPSRSKTPRSWSLDMFVPLGAIPRRRAAY